MFFTVDRPYSVSQRSMARSTKPAVISATGRWPSLGTRTAATGPGRTTATPRASCSRSSPGTTADPAGQHSVDPPRRRRGQRRSAGNGRGDSGAPGHRDGSAGVDAAERRRGQGSEHQGVVGHRLGDSLPAGHAGPDLVEHVGGYSREQDGHCDARRLRHRTCTTPSGWSALENRDSISPVAGSMRSDVPRSRTGRAQFPTRARVSAQAPKSFDSSRSKTCCRTCGDKTPRSRAARSRSWSGAKPAGRCSLDGST